MVADKNEAVSCLDNRIVIKSLLQQVVNIMIKKHSTLTNSQLISGLNMLNKPPNVKREQFLGHPMVEMADI